MAEPILTVEHLIKAYGETPVLDDISFAVKPGEVIVVVGPSGCGKSTLLRCLNGLEPTQSGRVRLGSETVAYGGKNLTQLRQRIGMVFQEPEHQFAANFVRDEVSIGPKSMGQSQDEAYQTADRMLEQMNLTRFAKANPYTLSGGEKRRLSVASMLAAAPKVLVMDEPTFGQDFSTWNEMVKLIAAIRDQGSCVIMVTHDEALVDALGARRVMFEEAKA